MTNTHTSMTQQFRMCAPLTESLGEYLREMQCNGDTEWYNEALEETKDEPLIKPVTTIVFDYPYGRQQHFILDEPVTTKHELIAALNKEMTYYLNIHPYSAPHAITDFVIEIIDIQPFNEEYAKAYVILGS